MIAARVAGVPTPLASLSRSRWTGSSTRRHVLHGVDQRALVVARRRLGAFLLDPRLAQDCHLAIRERRQDLLGVAVASPADLRLAEAVDRLPPGLEPTARNSWPPTSSSAVVGDTRDPA